MKKYFRIKIADGDPRVCDSTIDSENWINESLYANEYKEIHELPIRINPGRFVILNRSYLRVG